MPGCAGDALARNTNPLVCRGMEAGGVVWALGGTNCMV
jgi:hypothetical protein